MRMARSDTKLIPIFDQIVACKNGFVGLMHNKKEHEYSLFLSNGKGIKPKYQVHYLDEDLVLKLKYISNECVVLNCEEADGEMVPFVEFDILTESVRNIYRVDN